MHGADSSSPFLSEEVSISPNSQSGFYSNIISHNNTGDNSNSSNGHLVSTKTKAAASIASNSLVNFTNNGGKPHRRGPGRPRKELLSGQQQIKVVSRRGGASNRGIKRVRGGGVTGQSSISMQNFKKTFACKVSKNSKFDAKIIENHCSKPSSSTTDKYDKHCSKQWINNSVTAVAGSTITTSNTMANASMTDVQQVANQQEVDTTGRLFIIYEFLKKN